MSTSPSSSLRLALIGSGTEAGNWGNLTNTNLGTLLEQAICGFVNVTVSNTVDTTLVSSNYVADQSRSAVINLTGALTATRNVIAPAQPKIYIIKNSTTGGHAITFKSATIGSVGISIPNGKTALVYFNSLAALPDFEQVVPYFADNANTLTWKNFSGGLLFDASAGTTPTGTTVNNTNATIPWIATYPSLMGWNGTNTFGVRVDSARLADSATSATTQAVATNNTTVATTAFVKSAGLGWGQTWQNPARVISPNGDNYTNATGKPIFVVIIGRSTSGAASIFCNGITVGIINSSTDFRQETVSFIVPSGSNYGMVGGVISTWSELR